MTAQRVSSVRGLNATENRCRRVCNTSFAVQLAVYVCKRSWVYRHDNLCTMLTMDGYDEARR